jgi:hypothetical protein
MSKPNFDFSGGRCKWLPDDPRDPSCRQCRKAPVAGRPYCPEHLARAYVPGSAKNARDLDPWTKTTPVEAEAA